MSDDPALPTDPAFAEILQRLDRRLARLEDHLELPPFEPDAPPPGAGSPDRLEIPSSAVDEEESEGEFEFVVGENWFASVGVLVVTLGVGFALLLPLAAPPAGGALPGRRSGGRGAAAAGASLADVVRVDGQLLPRRRHGPAVLRGIAALLLRLHARAAD